MKHLLSISRQKIVCCLNTTSVEKEAEVQQCPFSSDKKIKSNTKGREGLQHVDPGVGTGLHFSLSYLVLPVDGDDTGLSLPPFPLCHQSSKYVSHTPS